MFWLLLSFVILFFVSAVAHALPHNCPTAGENMASVAVDIILGALGVYALAAWL